MSTTRTDDGDDSNFTTKSTTLSAAIEAYRRKNGPHLPANADSIEVQKLKVQRWLRARNFTEADLPADFWSLSEGDRGPVLYELGREHGASKRLAKRELRSIEKGYPPGYLLMSEAERKRVGNRVRQRRKRAKDTQTRTPVASRHLESGSNAVMRDWAEERLQKLRLWTSTAHPAARQLRGRELELLKADCAERILSLSLGRKPSYTELANKLKCRPRTARNRIRVVRRLCTADGPWNAQ